MFGDSLFVSSSYFPKSSDFVRSIPTKEITKARDNVYPATKRKAKGSDND